MTDQHHHPRRVHPLLFTVKFLMIFVLSDGLFADELDIPDTPLILGISVKPNVFLLLDNSGSMNAEILRRPETIPLYPGFNQFGNLDITPTRTNRREIFESCPGYNALYYDPNNVYTPWVGVDVNGDQFTDIDIAAAPSNPYFPDVDQVDLLRSVGGGSVAGYMVWNDADGDGKYDIGECPTLKLLTMTIATSLLVPEPPQELIMK